jgi:transcriptional regulator
MSPLRSTATDRIELLKGTLDLLVLRTLVFGPMHGHGIARAIQNQSDDLLLVDHGSLYPALHRLVRQRWLEAEWKDTPKGRPMKFYRLTPAGRKHLAAEESNWKQLARAIGLVLSRSELKRS